MAEEKEYIIFCDESDGKGKFYSNFYGGLIIGASQYQRITDRLNEKKRELNLHGEVKWSKVTERYLEKYSALVTVFFEEVIAGNLKVRVMFRQNADQPTQLSDEDHEMGYFKLYYQFIKHAFGFIHIQPRSTGTKLRIYFDQFPDTREKVVQFKGYLLGLGKSLEFRRANILLFEENITEVRSHDHVLLQCLDIILGSISFRLNDRHLEKPPGASRRGKRTIAKEKLYRRIRNEICKIRTNFNIGESTSLDGELENRWRNPYSHWKFQPKVTVYNKDATKSGHRKRRPTSPT
jgi:hypothetical protein